MWTDRALPPERMLKVVEAAVPLFERERDHEGLARAELLRFHALDQVGLPKSAT